MSDFALNELEVAPPEVVIQSARDFAAALVETPQFQAFEAAIREGADVVIASRYQPGAQIIGVPRHRQLMSNGMAWLFRTVAPVRGMRVTAPKVSVCPAVFTALVIADANSTTSGCPTSRL